MARLYPSNEAADISGYKALYVNMRRPGSTAVATSVTNTTASGNLIQTTATAGGTALAFITKPFAAAVTITSIQTLVTWAKESAAAANANIGYALYKYTAGAEEATFWGASPAAAELGVSVGGTGNGCARVVTVTTTGTATAFAVGDRLVLKYFLCPTGTMGGSETVTIAFDGTTEGTEGDSFLDIPEAIRVNEQQTGPGTFPTMLGVGQGFFQNIIDGLNAAVGGKVIPNTNAVTAVIDELTYQRDNL